MRKHLGLLLVLSGMLVALGASNAKADEIDFTASTIGSIDINCQPGGPCTLNLNAPVGGSGFYLTSDNSLISGTYAFSGGPSSIVNLQTSNGGITFTADASGSWLFDFSDSEGDSISGATATWTAFFNVSPLGLGFNAGVLTISGGSCTPGNGNYSSVFCNDFGNGSTIDVTLENMPTDLGSMYSEGTSATGVKIESGSVTAVPEPGSLALLGSGLIGLAGFLRRKISKI